MGAAVERIRAAIAAGKRICVHGDYDVDGICATVLAVLVLRELGAEVEWHLPSRFDEGYGVSGQTLERLAEEGCGLVLTVDCGITAVEEVRRARELGLDVIVTDHHRPGDELPDCPIARPARPTIRSRTCVGPASSTSSARHCWGRSPRCCVAISISWRSRRSRTSSRSSVRTDRLRSRGCARSHERRSWGCAR